MWSIRQICNWESPEGWKRRKPALKTEINQGDYTGKGF